MIRNRTLSAVTFALAAVLALTACTGPAVTGVEVDPSTGAALGEAAGNAARDGAAPTTGPNTVKVGGSVIVDSGGTKTTWTLVEVKRDKGDRWQSADNGLFLSAHFKIRVNEGEAFLSGGDLTLVTADGQVIEQSYVVDFKGRNPVTVISDLRTGQHVDGWVFFDASPAQLSGAKIQLKQLAFFGDDPVGYWTL
jgi:hypothetical protein